MLIVMIYVLYSIQIVYSYLNHFYGNLLHKFAFNATEFLNVCSLMTCTTFISHPIPILDNFRRFSDLTSNSIIS